MNDNSNKISNFWQELKRRKVIRVITVYAAAAFVIIELINNVYEPEFQKIVRDVEAKYQAEHERVRQWLEENEML